MPSQITVTGKTGPNQTVTGLVLQNVQRFSLDVNSKVLQVGVDPPTTNVKEFDISAATVFTVTIAAGNYTIAIS